MTALHPNKPEKKVEPKIDHQLRVLFDNSNEFKICMLDAAGRIIGWNSGAEKLTGHTSKEVLGKNYSSFTSKEEAHHNVFKKALAISAKTGQYVAEGIRVRKDGSHFWARSFLTPMKEADGSIKFFVMITRDVTRERGVEQKMSQKRDEYIGIASHELKNPITTLSLYSEILAKRLELERDKKSLRMLRDMQGQTARLVTLVDDLFVVSKVEGGILELHKEVFNPNTFITGIVRGFQQRTTTHKIICKATFGPNVRADKSRIRQVVINLLTNAVKYSPQSDKVIVRTRFLKNTCVISIQNFGPSIGKNNQREIFTKYFRVGDVGKGKIAGSGLGLYISKEIMKAHNQKLWVESTGKQGATFSFTLSSV